jgi:hypothetical protein
MFQVVEDAAVELLQASLEAQILLPVRSTSRLVSWLRTPMTLRIPFGDSSKLWPATEARPEAFLRRVVRARGQGET